MLSLDQDDAGYLRELAQWVAIPSVSRDASAQTMAEAAQWLASRLAFANARVEPTAGHPVVRGEWLGRPGAPTVLVYGHFDVQPTGDAAEWLSPPFELTPASGPGGAPVVRGRGSSDDKGPVYIAAKTLQAFAAQEGGLPLNVKFLFEGEEEIGSPHLPGYVREQAGELAADLVISADGAMWRPSEPSLSLMSKGLVSLDIVAEGARDDLHSGRYGGTVPNPLHALAAIVASLHDDGGTVTVPGFYDGIPPLTDARRAELAAVDFSGPGFLADLGLAQGHGEAGYSTLEQLWERPTLEVNGISGGGKYTVIPHVAVASVSCRLVPGQDPDAVIAAITAHVAAQPHGGAVISVRPDETRIPAYTIAAGHPAIRAASAALASVYPGQDVLLACIPGTLPATGLFEQVLAAKTLFFSFSTSDEKLHAPNEFLRVSRVREGMRGWEALLRLLADGAHRLAPAAEAAGGSV
jgi:acetylornithine deacetylase/succinyl-diaminopimelate desuccinylase-like protein